MVDLEFINLYRPVCLEWASTATDGAKAVLTDTNMSTYEFLGLGSIKEAKGALV